MRLLSSASMVAFNHDHQGTAHSDGMTDTKLTIVPNTRLKESRLSTKSAAEWVMTLSEWYAMVADRLLAIGEWPYTVLTPDVERYCLQDWLTHSIELTAAPNMLSDLLSALNSLNLWLIDDTIENTQPEYALLNQAKQLFADRQHTHQQIMGSALGNLLYQQVQALPLVTQRWVIGFEAICFDGFLEFNPTVSVWIQCLTALSIDLTLVTVDRPSHEQALLSDEGVKDLITPDAVTAIEGLAIQPYESFQHEWQAAYQQFLADKPKGKAAIIVPNLGQCQILCKDTINQFANPRSDDTATALESIVTDIDYSAGTPLIEQPIVQTAIGLLSLIARLPLEEASLTHLYRSPYLGDILSLQHRMAEFERVQQSVQRNEKAQPLTETLIQCLCETIDGFEKVFETAFPKSDSVAKWIAQWIAVLSTCAWPGMQSLTSFEFQVVKRCFDSLQGLADLSVVAPTLSFTELMNHWQDRLRRTPFQTESDQPKLHVMGVLEGVGQSFDWVWFCHLNQEVWPSVATHNPFIPYDIQRRYQLPHASTEREMHYAKEILAAYIGSSEKVYASYALRDGTQSQMPSPLIAESTALLPASLSPSEPIQLVRHHQPLRQPLKHSPTLTVEPIDYAPKGLPLSKQVTEVSGGSRVFTDGLTCQFMAYANLQLNAKPYEQYPAGISYKDKGNAVHHCLEQLMQSLPTQERLKALPDEARYDLVCAAVRQVGGRLRESHYPGWWVDCEETRLIQLLMDWLAFESDREAPYKVFATEMKSTVTVGTLTIRVRIDRIDQTADGQLHIFDYKTGQQHWHDWTGPMLSAQLPLYWLALDRQPVASLGYAQVNAKQLDWIGVSQSPLMTELTNVQTLDMTWDDLRAQWHQQLLSVSDSISLGHAAVEPVNPSVCRYCAHAPLCRIHTLSEGDHHG